MTKEQIIKQLLDMAKHPTVTLPRDCEALKIAADLLAQPEQEPVAKNESGRITWLIDDWPQNCFLYSEPPSWTPVEIGVDVTPEGAHVVGMYVLPDAVRYVFYSKFHTTPPQRTWEGLSVFEINDLVENTEYEDYRDLVERTEAKLKEKNSA